MQSAPNTIYLAECYCLNILRRKNAKFFSADGCDELFGANNF